VRTEERFRGRGDRVEIALDERLVVQRVVVVVVLLVAVVAVVEVAAAVEVAVIVSVAPPLSPSVRLSSMSTVCVIASVSVGCGCGAAGAMVALFSPPAVAVSDFRHAPSASRSETTATRLRMVELFTKKDLSSG
jgi:hypothetical protein